MNPKDTNQKNYSEIMENKDYNFNHFLIDVRKKGKVQSGIIELFEHGGIFPTSTITDANPYTNELKINDKDGVEFFKLSQNEFTITDSILNLFYKNGKSPEKDRKIRQQWEYFHFILLKFQMENSKFDPVNTIRLDQSQIKTIAKTIL